MSSQCQLIVVLLELIYAVIKALGKVGYNLTELGAQYLFRFMIK